MRILRLIGDNLALLTGLGAIIAFVHPPIFLIFKDVFLWMFAATMFALGTVLDTNDLKITLKQPGKIAAGLMTQYTIMPLLGFTAAWFADLPPDIAIGLIIVACAPGAMASNVIVYLAGGALAFSIALTTVATFLSPIVTPSLVQWLGGAFLPIEFWPMMKTILQTVLVPLLFGIGLKALLKDKIAPVAKAAPAIAVLAIVIICSYAVAANQTRIVELGPSLLLIVITINAFGYIIGWQLAKLYGFDHRHKVALSIEIGMQNAGLGVALALKHFSPEAALPGAIFAVWCILTAAGMTAFLRKRSAVKEFSGFD